MASIPPRPDGDSDESRLPWLDGTPPAFAARAVRPPGGSGMRWFVSLLILALVTAGAFVLGRGSDKVPEPVAMSLPPAQPIVPPTAPVVAPASPTEPVSQTPPALARVAEEPQPATNSVRVVAVPASPSPGGLHLSQEQIRAVRKIVREAQVNVHRDEIPRLGYSPKLAPSGRVVQLGAYHSAREAEAAAQRFRYKYRGLLEALPKAVLPFQPKGARKMFYRVQFVTPSQAYAEVTCQRLRAAAKTCIVVY